MNTNMIKKNLSKYLKILFLIIITLILICYVSSLLILCYVPLDSYTTERQTFTRSDNIYKGELVQQSSGSFILIAKNGCNYISTKSASGMITNNEIDTFSIIYLSGDLKPFVRISNEYTKSTLIIRTEIIGFEKAYLEVMLATDPLLHVAPAIMDGQPKINAQITLPIKYKGQNIIRTQ